MAAIHSVNTNRIKWCLNDRRITTQELADQTGIDLEKLKAVLRNQDNLSLSQLKNVAKFFNRGLLFFVSKEDVKEEKLRTVGFRTVSNQHPNLDPNVKALMERVERQRQVLLSLREELGEDVQPKFQPPELQSGNLKSAAASTRRWLSLNGGRTFDDYRRAIESRGVLVFLSNGYRGAWQVPSESEVAGFSIPHTHFPIIFVRKENSKQRQLFTLAHELGHILIHRTGSVDDEDDLYESTGKERDANAFAGHLLVPDDFLTQIDDREKPDLPDDFEAWLRPHTIHWGVSVEVILRRLMDASRVSRGEYRAYRKWKAEQKRPETSGGTRIYRYREPVHMFGKPFVGVVLDALATRHITATKASRFLDNIKITDVHKLEREFNAL